MFGFKAEPAAIAEIIRLVAGLLGAFGVVQITGAEIDTITASVAAVFAAVSVVLTIITRANVTSQETLESAGVTQEQVVKVAEDPSRVLVAASTSAVK